MSDENNRRYVGEVFIDGKSDRLLQEFLTNLFNSYNGPGKGFNADMIDDWHLEDMFDRVIFVYVNKNVQELRLSKRDNIDLEYAKKKINSQIDIEEKYQLAKSRKDYIVDNNGTIDALNPQIDEILKEIENEI